MGIIDLFLKEAGVGSTPQLFNVRNAGAVWKSRALSLQILHEIDKKNREESCVSLLGPVFA
jgi:hypothetical protein